jgi:hypothetical protein
MKTPARVILTVSLLFVVHSLADRANAASLVAATLPTSRSVQVGTAATAFATILNVGPDTATRCSLAPKTAIPASFTYRPPTRRPTR